MITQARLRELLDYDPETGVFVWKVRRSRSAKAGSVAGSRNLEGYINIKIAGSTYKAHRLVWLYAAGKLPRKQIDHINCVRDDNRLVNLREASPNENARNALRRGDNTSGYRGVSWDVKAGKWRAYIFKGGAQTHLGYFDRAEDAAAAYAEASVRFHKDFGRTM